MDIDYMDKYLDFTVDPINFNKHAVKQFIDKLHRNHQRFVPIVDPAIYMLDESYSTYTNGLEQNVFVKDLEMLLI
jgi:alpha-glucosidase